MSKPFKIILTIILLFLYYATIPTLAVVYLGKSEFLKKSPLSPVLGWAILLLPVVIIIAKVLVKRKKK